MTQLKISNKRITMVIIEDYKLIRYGIIMGLKEYKNIEIVGDAQDGETGLQLIAERHPDIILLDLGLPYISGIDVIREVKNISPESKIIILTSHTNKEEAIATLALGAKAYCLKDISQESLVFVIDHVMSGGSWIDPYVTDAVLGRLPMPETFDFIATDQENKIKLTERETSVLKLLIEGKSNTEIAEALIVSVHTAKAHVCNILQKLFVEDRVQAAVKAVREHLV